MDFKDVLNEAKGRFNSPLYATFVVSWLIINWRILFYTLSSLNISDKISEISNLLGQVQYSFFLPVAVTAVYLFGYKWVESWIKVYLNIVKRFDKNKAIESTGKTYFTGEDYLAQIQKNEKMSDLNIELRKELADLKTSLAQEKDFVTKQISEILALQSLLKEKSNYNSHKNLVGKWTFKERQNSAYTDQTIEIEASQKNANELVFVILDDQSKKSWLKSLIYRQINNEVFLAVQDQSQIYFLRFDIDKIDSVTGEIMALSGIKKIGTKYTDIRMERVEW